MNESKQESTSKQRVVYILPQIDRIGQLAGELLWLRNVYDTNHYDITLLTFPPTLKPRTNLAMYEIGARGLDVVHSEDDNVIWFTHRNRDLPVYIENNTIFHLYDSRLLFQFVKKYNQEKKLSYHFELSEEEKFRGKELERKFNIPEGAPIITLHAREGGYLPEKSYHSFRDITIEHYLPALEYLIEQGYYIIRLGDSSMARFNNPPPQLIDTPWHPDYEHLVEPYFMSTAKFSIGSTSGPTTIQQGFGTPAIHVNANIGYSTHMWGDDITVPRHYYSRDLGRELNFWEVLHSPLLDFWDIKQFEEHNLSVRENTPKEILAAVIEMEKRLDNNYASKSEINSFNENVWQAAKEANISRVKTHPDDPIYFALLDSQFSMEYGKLNPDYFKR